jgi:hypothetical protein
MVDPQTVHAAAQSAAQTTGPGPGSFIIWDWATMASISLAFTGVGSALTWLWTRAGKSALLAQQVRTAESTAKAAVDRAEKAQAAYDKLLGELHAHMLADAASFARLETIASTAANATIASESRLTVAMDKLSGRLDSMADRFDAFLARASAMHHPEDPTA